MFRGLFTMNETCPACAHRFEREQGFFQGAMYISWVLGVTYLAVLALLAQVHWSSTSESPEPLCPYWRSTWSAFPLYSGIPESSGRI